MFIAVLFARPISRILLDGGLSRGRRPQKRIEVDVHLSNGVVRRVSVVIHDSDRQRFILDQKTQLSLYVLGFSSIYLKVGDGGVIWNP